MNDGMIVRTTLLLNASPIRICYSKTSLISVFLAGEAQYEMVDRSIEARENIIEFLIFRLFRAE